MTFARCCAFAGMLVAFAAAPALADSAASIGLTLSPIAGGVHDSFNDTIHLPPIPVPLLEASARMANFEITAYGLPPLVTIPYTNAVQGSVALRLSIFDGTFRI
jgi:hypothetical protein